MSRYLSKMEATVQLFLMAVLSFLLTGCLGLFGELVIPKPVPGSGTPAYEYKMVYAAHLYLTIRNESSFKNASNIVVTAEGLSRFGKAGWRYVGCYRRLSPCDILVFEHQLPAP